MSRTRLSISLLMLLASLSAGCTELRGRKRIQEGHAAYKRGDFARAAELFADAATFVPDMPLVWLNRGYACRELLLPGAAAPANQKAAACALDSFKRLRQLDPNDPRGDRLYVQTLFDVGEYKTIERGFVLRHERNPNDLDAVLVLEQVYFKLGRWRDALAFYRKAAALRSDDAESQYAVGNFIWQILQTHGGGSAWTDYDPRPRPERTAPPAAMPGDIVGAERVALAEEGIRYLGKASSLRPHFSEALTYIGLLYRQQSFGQVEDVPAWQSAVSQSLAFAARAAEKP